MLGLLLIWSLVRLFLRFLHLLLHYLLRLLWLMLWLKILCLFLLGVLSILHFDMFRLFVLFMLFWLFSWLLLFFLLFWFCSCWYSAIFLILLALESFSWVTVFNFIYDFCVCNRYSLKRWAITSIFGVILTCKISHTLSAFLWFLWTFRCSILFTITVLCISVWTGISVNSINANFNRFPIF